MKNEKITMKNKISYLGQMLQLQTDRIVDTPQLLSHLAADWSSLARFPARLQHLVGSPVPPHQLRTQTRSLLPVSGSSSSETLSLTDDPEVLALAKWVFKETLR